MRQRVATLLHYLPNLLLLFSLVFGLCTANSDFTPTHSLHARSPGNDLQPRGQKRKASGGKALASSGTRRSTRRQDARTKDSPSSSEERPQQRQRLDTERTRSLLIGHHMALERSQSRQQSPPPRRGSPGLLQQTQSSPSPTPLERGRSVALPNAPAASILGAGLPAVAVPRPIRLQASFPSASLPQQAAPNAQVCSVAWSTNCQIHLSITNPNQNLAQSQQYPQPMQIAWPPVADAQHNHLSPPPLIQFPPNQQRYWQFPSVGSPPQLREISRPLMHTQTQMPHQSSAQNLQLQQWSAIPPRQPASVPTLASQPFGYQFQHVLGSPPGSPRRQVGLAQASSSPSRRDGLVQQTDSPSRTLALSQTDSLQSQSQPQPRSRNQFEGIFDSPPRRHLLSHMGISPPQQSQIRNRFPTPGSPIPGDPFFLSHNSLLNEPFFPPSPPHMQGLPRGGAPLYSGNVMQGTPQPSQDFASNQGFNGIEGIHQFNNPPSQANHLPISMQSMLVRSQASFVNRQFLGASSSVALGQSSVQQFDNMHHGLNRPQSSALYDSQLQHGAMPNPISWNFIREQQARQEERLRLRQSQDPALQVQRQAQQVLQRSHQGLNHATGLLERAAEQRSQHQLQQQASQQPSAQAPAQEIRPDVQTELAARYQMLDRSRARLQETADQELLAQNQARARAQMINLQRTPSPTPSPTHSPTQATRQANSISRAGSEISPFQLGPISNVNLRINPNHPTISSHSEEAANLRAASPARPAQSQDQVTAQPQPQPQVQGQSQPHEQNLNLDAIAQQFRAGLLTLDSIRFRPSEPENPSTRSIQAQPSVPVTVPPSAQAQAQAPASSPAQRQTQAQAQGQARSPLQSLSPSEFERPETLRWVLHGTLPNAPWSPAPPASPRQSSPTNPENGNGKGTE